MEAYWSNGRWAVVEAEEDEVVWLRMKWKSSSVVQILLQLVVSCSSKECWCY